MLCVDAVRRDVLFAKRLAASSGTPTLGRPTQPHASGCLPITVSDPLPHSNGTMVVTIRLERAFAGSRQADPHLAPVIVCVEWEVFFSVAYPKEPCVWRLIDGLPAQSSTDVDYRVVRLQSFLMEEVLSRLPKAKKTYLAAYVGEAGGGSATYHRTSRGDAATLRSQTELATGTPLAEMYPGLGSSGRSNNNNKNKQNSNSGSRQDNSHNNGSNSNSNKDTVGVVASPFLSDFAFLCSWWAALELDVGCIISVRQNFTLRNISSGSIALLEEDAGSCSYIRQGRGMHFLDEVGGNRVQHPGRGFAAVFMPRGDVIAWGLRQLPQIAKKKKEEANCNTATGKTNSSILGTASHEMVPQSSGGGWSGYYTGYMESSGRYGYHNQDDQYNLQSRRAQQALRITSVRSDMDGAVLPSLLVSSNILQTGVYDLNDVCLYATDPSVALCQNALISREGKALNDVSNAFLILRHLVKGVSPHASSRYALQLLAPTLHELVKSIQEQRKPFWAGVAVCCVLLPAILNDRPMPFEITAHLIDPVECYRCVSIVAMIFSTVGATNKFREAELTKSAILSAYRCKKPPASLICRSVDCEESKGNSGPITPVYQVPITECAVCGMPLLRDIRRGTGTATGNPSNTNLGSGDDAVLDSARKDGCIIVQCVRCGHGGHVAHILAWWNDKNVRCCPMGCDCLCIY
ncbi:hypothetical protein MOQ_005070 [Trypanosoma cruzi marinkellei]|uniref:Uncharacterized protein n=1 Tax=Trypanosoma cruzi marinkellei TaxID=85056 RepID=K2MVL9_TRYCR|nr:hypothetical protein MOQ_005070 [Trypanosoma cruzi marinkellei]